MASDRTSAVMYPLDGQTLSFMEQVIPLHTILTWNDILLDDDPAVHFCDRSGELVET